MKNNRNLMGFDEIQSLTDYYTGAYVSIELLKFISFQLNRTKSVRSVNRLLSHVIWYLKPFSMRTDTFSFVYYRDSVCKKEKRKIKQSRWGLRKMRETSWICGLILSYWWYYVFIVDILAILLTVYLTEYED